MTNKEALNILYKGIAPNPKANDECIMLCKQALEKQIPKKVIPVVRDKPYIAIIGYDCPRCYKDVVGSGSYCWACGQALDWSEQIR